MSSMLEQAIIDANALKEVALKNAESILLEKYSKNLKEAVESMLEADDLPGMEDPLSSGMPGAEGIPQKIQQQQMFQWQQLMANKLVHALKKMKKLKSILIN